MCMYVLAAMAIIVISVVTMIAVHANKVSDPRVTIKVSPETYQFMKELNRRISTQDNRATAKPYFFVIRTEKWRVAHSEFHSGTTRDVWVDFNGDPTTFLSQEEAVEWYCDNHRKVEHPGPYGDADDIAAFIRAEEELKSEAMAWFELLPRYVEEMYFEENNAFLTEEGYNEHMTLNGHNVKRMGKHHTYLKHAFRNPEMDSLFRAIKEIGEA